MYDSQASLKDQILYFSTFGQNHDGSISRMIGSEAYMPAAEAVKHYFEDCGMTAYIDAIGNVHGILPGTAPEAERRVLLMGSHLDTVKEGGMFDGQLGFLAAAECVKRLRKEGLRLPFDLHILANNGEEGNDLGGTFGSRCAAGQFDFDDPAKVRKAAAFGLSEKMIRSAELDFSKVIGWLELHIEQGPTLDTSGEKIGVIDAIVGLQRYRIDVEGVSNHAGTTMMPLRKDAMVRAARIISRGDALCRELGNDLVATFSCMEVHPNAVSVINDRVSFTVEFRNRDEALLERFIAQLRQEFEGDDGVKVSFTPLVKKKPVFCDPLLMEKLSSACEALGLPYRQMSSGATHDGSMLALRCPIAMIFVPSRGGISHSVREWTDWEDCEAGADVLYRTVLSLC